jgi:hypothetical protein
MTFAEAQEFRALQTLMAHQAGMDNHARRRKRVPVVREAIKNAVAEKASLGVKTSASNARIRENRKQERAAQRSAGLNGSLPKPPAPETGAPGATPSPPSVMAPAKPDPAGSPNPPPAVKRPATSAVSLWGKVDAVNKH